MLFEYKFIIRNYLVFHDDTEVWNNTSLEGGKSGGRQFIFRQNISKRLKGSFVTKIPVSNFC